MFWAAAAAEYNISYAYNWITSARRPVKELRSAFEKAWQNFFVIVSVSPRKTLPGRSARPSNLRADILQFFRVVNSVEDCELDEQSCPVIPRDTAAAADKSGP